MRTDRVLVAIDLCGSSTEVVQAASALAQPLGAQVVLLNVVSVPAGVNPFGEASDGRTFEQVLDADAYNDMEPLVALMERDGVSVVKDLAHGDPVRAILEAVDRHQVGFVVMGTHGRVGLDRWLHGSVAEGVLHDCPVPVLIVRPPAAGLDPTE